MSFDWKQYTGNLDWLQTNTIYLSIHGSHAYGTNIETSDVDVRGVAIAPKEYYLGGYKNFEQAQQNEPDITIFELKKFVKLASACNPNVLEVLYTDEEDHLIKTNLGRKLLDIRDSFLCKKVKDTFFGYSFSQLKRIQLHKRYLLHPIEIKPERKDFGLPEKKELPKDQFDAANALIESKLNRWRLNKIENLDYAEREEVKNEVFDIICEVIACNYTEIEKELYNRAGFSVGFNSNFIEYMAKEKEYSIKLKEWHNYQEWKKNRNPVRAAMEAEFGLDLKHALHLTRLLLMCEEILETGKVIVKRPDYEYLLDIRRGKYSYDEILEFAKKQEERIRKAFNNTKLPEQPNIKLIEKTCVELIEQSFRKID